MAILVFTNLVQVWHVFVIALLLGIRNAVDMPTSQAFAVELFKHAVEIPSPATDKRCAAAAAAGVNVVMCLTEKRPGTTGTLYNTQLYIGRDGRILGRHRKLVPTVGERLVHAPGEAAAQGAVRCDFGPASGLICGENSKPLTIAAVYASLGDEDHAMQWLEQAFREKDWQLRSMLNFDSPYLRSLKGNPRFEALRNKVLATRFED